MQCVACVVSICRQAEVGPANPPSLPGEWFGSGAEQVETELGQRTVDVASPERPAAYQPTRRQRDHSARVRLPDAYNRQPTLPSIVRGSPRRPGRAKSKVEGAGSSRRLCGALVADLVKG